MLWTTEHNRARKSLQLPTIWRKSVGLTPRGPGNFGLHCPSAGAAGRPRGAVRHRDEAGHGQRQGGRSGAKRTAAAPEEGVWLRVCSNFLIGHCIATSFCRPLPVAVPTDRASRVSLVAVTSCRRWASL